MGKKGKITYIPAELVSELEAEMKQTKCNQAKALKKITKNAKIGKTIRKFYEGFGL